MSSYKVISASLTRDSAILKVLGDEGGSHGSSCFSVVGELERKLQLRGGRPTYDSEGRLAKELIFIFEVPAFDVTTLVGKIISNELVATTDASDADS